MMRYDMPRIVSLVLRVLPYSHHLLNAENAFTEVDVISYQEAQSGPSQTLVRYLFQAD